MSTIVLDDKILHLPAWGGDLESFCRWACSAEYPKQGWFSYLNGELWMDLSMEEMNHNQLKGIFAIIVGHLVLTLSRGRYFHDRMRLTNGTANLATEPDGMFVSEESIRANRVVLVVGEGESPVRVEGTPDMVLEVVSPGSVDKDTVELRQLYWDAGIREYWLVDPLGSRLTFDILRHTPRGYVPTRKQGGWVKSAVFGKSFRLGQQTGEDGFPRYTLEVR
jgi:Uma2 family endonuclease